MQFLTYEHPLNEKYRAYLRIEYLYRQVQQSAVLNTPYQYVPFFHGLFGLQEITERNDIRNELIKDLEKDEKYLVQWSEHPDVCDSALQDMLKQVIQLQSQIYQLSKSLNQLKDNVFLSTVRQRFSIPGGSCSFDLPQLHYWLQQPKALRDKEIALWLATFQPLISATQLTLTLSRERVSFQPFIAENGFYQSATDNVELLRIQFDEAVDLFPTVSGNKHRFSIRFMQLDKNKGKVPYDQEVNFQLACC